MSFITCTQPFYRCFRTNLRNHNYRYLASKSAMPTETSDEAMTQEELNEAGPAASASRSNANNACTLFPSSSSPCEYKLTMRSQNPDDLETKTLELTSFQKVAQIKLPIQSPRRPFCVHIQSRKLPSNSRNLPQQRLRRDP